MKADAVDAHDVLDAEVAHPAFALDELVPGAAGLEVPQHPQRETEGRGGGRVAHRARRLDPARRDEEDDERADRRRRDDRGENRKAHRAAHTRR
jgi:hypothetical protein